MSELQYTTVNRILARIYRELKDTNINESDAIEWIGEALEFLKVPQIQLQSVTFLKVNNYETDLPKGFQMVLQIARHNDWTSDDKEKTHCIPTDTVKEITKETEVICESCLTEPLDCNGNPLFKNYHIDDTPRLEMDWYYIPWALSSYYKKTFTPVRLADNTFFNSLVCKEKELYDNCGKDEYTIVGSVDKKLRFSFKEGYVALAYIKNATDKKTGYPLIPENISYTTAIIYYIKWKMAEMLSWNGREGFANLAKENERLWLKYVRQAKNYMKMPKSIDEFQNLLEQSHHLIPRHNRYYGYFGNLNREENRPFNDPDFRRRMTPY